MDTKEKEEAKASRPESSQKSKTTAETPTEKDGDEQIVTEVHIESVVEITQDEPAFANAPATNTEPQVEFVNEVKVPTVDLTEDSPPPTSAIEASEKQPELVYEYEQVITIYTCS